MWSPIIAARDPEFQEAKIYSPWVARDIAIDLVPNFTCKVEETGWHVEMQDQELWTNVKLI